jgi:hypothetical protein
VSVYLGIGLGMALIVLVGGTVWANQASDSGIELFFLAVSVVSATVFTMLAWPVSVLFALVCAPTVLRKMGLRRPP